MAVTIELEDPGQPGRTYFTTLIAKLRTRLMTVTGFEEERVLVDVYDTPEMFQVAAQYLIIQPGRQQTDQSAWTSRGRIEPLMVRTFYVTIWTRLDLDENLVSLQQLTHATLGHLQMEEKVLDALAGFQPVDDDDINLVAYPIAPHDATQPARKKDDRSWITSSIAFEMGYIMDLDQDYQ